MKRVINKLRQKRWEINGRNTIKKEIDELIKAYLPVKIVLGSSYVTPPMQGWVKTDLPQFDITNENHWKLIFGETKVDNFLAEHVFEHLYLEDSKKAFKFISNYLKTGGVFRFAVPDGYHTNPVYIDNVKPNGIGDGCHDHKVLFTIDTVTELAKNFPFKMNVLEYYTKDGELVSKKINTENGFINRTVTSEQKQPGELHNYSSIIIDFIKI
jgi:predicted SAM-dependent methyltransferase